MSKISVTNFNTHYLPNPSEFNVNRSFFLCISLIYIGFLKATMLVHILGSLCGIYILQIFTSSVTISFKSNKKYKICDHFKSLCFLAFIY